MVKMKLSEVVFLLVILFLNMEWIQPREIPSCLDGEKEITCILNGTDNSSYRLYGTKTIYKEYLKYSNISPPMDLNLQNCSVRAFYLFSRHATRYPNLGKIKEMMEMLPQLQEKILNASALKKGSVCMQDIKKLRRWVLNMTEENDNQISDSGVREAEEIAQRFQILFPSLLAQKYSPDRFTFEYTFKERTKSTAEAFAKGLFGDQSPNIDNSTNDEVLMFHKSCKSFRSRCKLDDSYDVSEVEKVEKGTLMKNLIDRMGEKLGFSVTKDEVDVMYLACFSEYALGLNDTWCRFFSKADLRVLEFEDDIDDYYKDGYGNKINYEQACPVAKYMMNFFRSTVNNSTSPPKAVFHFTHSGAIKKVLSMLGLHRDSLPLTADAFCRQTGRQWRSSLASPFAANLAFALLECGSGQFRVATLLNERPVTVSGCEGPVCSLKSFEEVYGPKADHCDLNRMCCTCCNKE